MAIVFKSSGWYVYLDDESVSSARFDRVSAMDWMCGISQRVECVEGYYGVALLLSDSVSFDSEDCSDALIAVSSLPLGDYLLLDPQESELVRAVLVDYGAVEMDLYMRFWRDGSVEAYVDDGGPDGIDLDRQALLKIVSCKDGSGSATRDLYDYTIEVTRVPATQGGGYRACVPALGRWSVQADGDTPEEALHELQRVYKSVAKLMGDGS